MRAPITEIEARLVQLQVPPDLIAAHVRKLEKWRVAHPTIIKRKRLYEFVLTANGHVVSFKPKKYQRHARAANKNPIAHNALRGGLQRR